MFTSSAIPPAASTLECLERACNRRPVPFRVVLNERNVVMQLIASVAGLTGSGQQPIFNPVFKNAIPTDGGEIGFDWSGLVSVACGGRPWAS